MKVMDEKTRMSYESAEKELYLYEAYREGVHRILSSEYLFDLEEGSYHAYSIAGTTPGFWGADGKIVDAVPIFVGKIEDEGYRNMVSKRLDPEWLRENLSDGHLEEIDYCRSIDGEVHWFRMNFTAVAFEPGDTVRYVLIVTTDITSIITEQEKLQEDLAAVNEKLSREMKILRAFKNIYFISYYLDVHYETVQVIEGNDEQRNFINQTNGNWQDAVQQLVQDLVAPEYAGGFNSFLNAKDLSERAGQSNLLTYDFFTRSGIWCRCNLIVASRDRNGQIDFAICAIQNITDEKK